MIRVTIRYRVNSGAWQEWEVPPHEYFDEGESLDNIGAAPKHNHAIDYLIDRGIPGLSQSLDTSITLVDERSVSRRVLDSHSWNESTNSITLRRDFVADALVYAEYVICTRVCEHPCLDQIVRFVPWEQYPGNISQIVVETNADGTQNVTAEYATEAE